jgi:site-specific DNA-methyltransferase (adenine-specific)
MYNNENIQLYNGDFNDYYDTVPDNSVDLIITDPPYGINYRSNKQSGSTRGDDFVRNRSSNYFEKIYGDSAKDFEITHDKFFKYSYSKLKNNSAIYVFCHWKNWSSLERLAIYNGFKIKNMIVINKSNHGMGDIKGQYAPKHELVLYASKGKHVLNIEGIGRGKDVIEGKVLYSGSKRAHPNEKPVSWIDPFLLRSSNIGDTILDPFMGSEIGRAHV